jgi:hypothetical protein
MALSSGNTRINLTGFGGRNVVKRLGTIVYLEMRDANN